MPKRQNVEEKMIKSMTGFGRSEVSDSSRKIVVEVKSVNHRYLDTSIKMPKKLNYFDAAIRNKLKEYIQRGKVDIFITYEDISENQIAIKYNESVASEYMNYLNKMSETFNIENDIKVTALAKMPEVLTLAEGVNDEDEIWNILCEALDKAFVSFVKTREDEGDRLKKDLIEKLDNMLVAVDFIEKRSPEIVNSYRSRLEDKVKELLGDTQIDESRIAAEVVIFADKICVDEETVRLRSHIENTKAALNGGGAVGRKLDFIAQEMNREANTILSKANDLEITNKAIELKTEIEKVREQIQNIE